MEFRQSFVGAPAVVRRVLDYTYVGLFPDRVRAVPFLVAGEPDWSAARAPLASVREARCHRRIRSCAGHVIWNQALEVLGVTG